MASIFQSFDSKLTRPIVIVSSCAVLGLSTYGVYCYFKNRNRMADEGFVDITVDEESTKKILVLGLDGAGKSTVISSLAKMDGATYEPDPTKEFNVLTVNVKPNKCLNFWEIGGSIANRAYWSTFALDADMLIYVVDSADEHKLAESVTEFHALITTCDKLKSKPIYIMASKHGLGKSASPESINDAFGVKELSRTHKAISVTKDIQKISGLLHHDSFWTSS